MKKETVYKVKHSRKGGFHLLVKDECETWVTGTIVQGVAQAINWYNDKHEGELITVRKSFCQFEEVVLNEKSSAAGN